MQQSIRRVLTRFIGGFKTHCEARPPAMENQSHIVPVRVGDPVHCEAVTDSLLNRYQVYALPINDPTVPRGTERMRFTLTPVHSDAQISDLIAALKELWVACPVGKGQYIKLAAE
jgi:5-aminolevulinate synthase